jgi:hypothetical protein
LKRKPQFSWGCWCLVVDTEASRIAESGQELERPISICPCACDGPDFTCRWAYLAHDRRANNHATFVGRWTRKQKPSLSFCWPSNPVPVAWRCRAKAAQGRQADWQDAGRPP